MWRNGGIKYLAGWNERNSDKKPTQIPNSPPRNPNGFTEIPAGYQRWEASNLCATEPALLLLLLLLIIIIIIIIIINISFLVHHCGKGGSMRACHAAGPGSIPGHQVYWMRFFRSLSSPVRQMSGSFRPTSFPNIIWPSWSSFQYLPCYRMYGFVNGVYRLSFSCCLGCGPGNGLIPHPGGPPCPCVVKKVCMRSKVNSFPRQVVAL